MTIKYCQVAESLLFHVRSQPCLSDSMQEKRVSMGWWLLRLSANFFQLRLTKKLKIDFFCFKELNISKSVFFVSSKQNKGLRIISG